MQFREPGIRFLDPGRPLPVSSIAKSWCALAAAAVLAGLYSIIWVDHQLAPRFLQYYERFDDARDVFDSPVIVGAEIAVLIVLALLRRAGGRCGLAAKAAMVAIGASLAAFMVNDFVLKTLFGRACPLDQLTGQHSDFQFFRGTRHTCFPSGHMVLASAFAFTLIRVYPRTWPVLALLLIVGAGLLLIADVHFLADLIAGTFFGASAGFAAGEFWLRAKRN